MSIVFKCMFAQRVFLLLSPVNYHLLFTCMSSEGKLTAPTNTPGNTPSD